MSKEIGDGIGLTSIAHPTELEEAITKWANDSDQSNVQPTELNPEEWKQLLSEYTVKDFVNFMHECQAFEGDKQTMSSSNVPKDMVR